MLVTTICLLRYQNVRLKKITEDADLFYKSGNDYFLALVLVSNSYSPITDINNTYVHIQMQTLKCYKSLNILSK